MSLCRTENRSNLWCIFAAIMFFVGVVTLGMGIATGSAIYIVGIVALALGAAGVCLGRATTPTD